MCELGMEARKYARQGNTLHKQNAIFTSKSFEIKKMRFNFVVHILAPVLSNQISLIHGSRISKEMLCCP